MQTYKIAIVLIILLTVIILVDRQETKQIKKDTNGTTNAPVDNSPTPSATATPLPTQIPSSPTPTPKKATQGSSLSKYQYPNATIISLSSNSLALESSDSPQTVTDWYKNILKEQGMNAVSFVQTNTNGNVLNKLSVAGGGQKVNVEIRKNTADTATKIFVSL